MTFNEWVSFLKERGGAAFRFATGGSDYVQRSLRTGVFLLIPILGIIVLLGWQRRLYLAAREGVTDEKPASLDDVNGGLPIFVNLLGLTVVLCVPVIVVMAVVRIFGGHNDAQEIGEPLFGLFELLLIAIWPEVLRRAYEEQSGFVWLNPRPSLERIRAHWEKYTANALLGFVASLIASLGVYACCVGVLFTAPLGIAVTAAVVAGWASDV